MCSNRTWSFCMSQGLVPHDPRWRERCGWQISSCFGVGPVCGQFLRGWCSWMCFGSCVAAPLHHNLLLISGFLRHHRTLNLPIFAIASHATKPSGHILAFFFIHPFFPDLSSSISTSAPSPTPIPHPPSPQVSPKNWPPRTSSPWAPRSGLAPRRRRPRRCAARPSRVASRPSSRRPRAERNICVFGGDWGGAGCRMMIDWWLIDDWLMIDWYWLILIDDWLILIDIDWWLIDVDWYWFIDMIDELLIGQSILIIWMILGSHRCDDRCVFLLGGNSWSLLEEVLSQVSRDWFDMFSIYDFYIRSIYVGHHLALPL